MGEGISEGRGLRVSYGLIGGKRFLGGIRTE